MHVIRTAFLAGGSGLSPSLKLATKASLALVKSAWFAAIVLCFQRGLVTNYQAVTEETQFEELTKSETLLSSVC